MVDRAKVVAVDVGQFVHRGIEEAADAGAAQAMRLGLQVEQLTDRARFPVQEPPGQRAEVGQRRLELGEHRHRERRGPGDRLIAADRDRGLLRVVRQQQEQRQVGGRTGCTFP